MSAPGSITVLRARGRRLAKLIRADGTLQGYDSARTFDMFEMPGGDLSAIARLLHRLLQRPDCCVVRGAIADPNWVRAVRRLVHPDPNTGEAPTLRDVPRQWLALDMEGVERPESVAASDLPACAREAIQRLPVAFHAAACIIQATGSHGIKPGCRLRLWYWLSRPTTGIELRHWLRATPADPIVFRAAQPIYTSAPVVAGGIDHLPQRMAERSGGSCVQVPDPETLRPSPRRNASRLPAATAANANSYAAAALRNAAVRVIAAGIGNRHYTVLREARGLARFIGAGLLTERDIRTTLGGAAEQAGKTADEAGSIIDWAMDHPSGAALPEGIAA